MARFAHPGLATQVYHSSAAPVEDYFREQGVLMEFSINGGISDTLPRLMSALAPYRRNMEQVKPEEWQATG